MTYTIKEKTVVFSGCTDIDLERTFNCGQCFRWNKWENGWRGFAGFYPCYVFFERDELCVQLLEGSVPMDIFADYMIHYLALDVDYNALKERFSRDETMKKAVEFSPGIRVLNQDFFETLLTFIISRNNNIPRIKKIVDAMSVKFGSKVGDMYAFPLAYQLKDMGEEQLAELKMGYRTKYIIDAVEKYINDEITPLKISDMTYDEAKKYLMKVKGVGPKVADCVLLFGCGKYEAFPKDVWINRALEQMFPNGLPECIKGYEGIAQQFIFQYARFNLEK